MKDFRLLSVLSSSFITFLYYPLNICRIFIVMLPSLSLYWLFSIRFGARACWCGWPLKDSNPPLWPFLCKASGGPFRICFYLGEPGKESCYKMMSFKSSQEIITYMLKKYLEDWTFLLINSGGINLKKRGIMGLRALS